MCVLPASLGIIVIALSEGDIGWVVSGIFLLLLALILLIPGIIFLIVGIKKDKKKLDESEAYKSEARFKSFSEVETNNSINKEKKNRVEKNKKNRKKQSDQEFTIEDFD